MLKKNLVLVFIVAGVIFTYLFHKEKFLIPSEKTEILMDTVVTVKVYGNNKKKLENIVNKAFEKMRKLSLILNNFDNRSEIFKINSNAGIKPVKVSAVTLDFLTESKRLCKKTGNFLDISIGSTLRLWGFASGHAHLPSEKSIEKSLELKGTDFILIDRDNSTVYICKKGVSIDVGAVAKGYIIDKAIEFLKSVGISKAVVNAGGDIRFIGLKSENTFWRVGIRNPLSHDKSDIIKVVNAGDEAIVTSGDYERYFIKNGKIYHHIINPFTGYPARKVHSVTVIADKAFIADGLATAIFVMGEKLFFEKYYKKFKNIKDFRVIIIKGDNVIIDSKALQ